MSSRESRHRERRRERERKKRQDREKPGEKRVWGKRDLRGQYAPPPCKTTERIDQNTLAASRPEKRPQKGASNLQPPQSTERIRENTKAPWGPEWYPDKTQERRDARPKRAINQVLQGQNKEKGNKPKRRMRSVHCDYLSCISPKNDDDGKPKKKRTNPETHDLTLREFSNSFGSEVPKPETKTWAKHHRKNTRSISTPKKNSLPKIYSQQRP